MLRITTIDDGSIITFRLEGRLVGQWVGELERCWTSSKATDSNRKFNIDLTDVDFIDDKGEALLERVHVDGGNLQADNPYTRSVIAGVVKRSGLQHAC